MRLPTLSLNKKQVSTKAQKSELVGQIKFMPFLALLGIFVIHKVVTDESVSNFEDLSIIFFKQSFPESFNKIDALIS